MTGRVYFYTLIDGHNTMVQNVIIAVAARAGSSIRRFCATSVLAAIQSGNTIIVNRSFRISNIINNALALHRQSCTLGNSNGIALNIGQLLAIQVESNGLVSRNNNIFRSILYEFNGIAIRCLFNSICYRRIVGITILCSCVNRARNTTTLSQSYLTRARSNIAGRAQVVAKIVNYAHITLDFCVNRNVAACAGVNITRITTAIYIDSLLCSRLICATRRNSVRTTRNCTIIQISVRIIALLAICPACSHYSRTRFNRTIICRSSTIVLQTRWYLIIAIYIRCSQSAVIHGKRCSFFILNYNVITLYLYIVQFHLTVVADSRIGLHV
jgi:hypothetical protein